MSDELRREKDRVRAANYRRANPDKAKEISRRANAKRRKDPAIIVSIREYQKEYRDKNRETLAAKERERKFGISHAEYAELHQRQGGVCAICKKPETATRNGKVKSLAVDHCHSTGRIRGLLCADCNTGIGKLREDRNIFLAAIQYLENT
jgi:hypothetical protein